MMKRILIICLMPLVVALLGACVPTTPSSPAEKVITVTSSVYFHQYEAGGTEYAMIDVEVSEGDLVPLVVGMAGAQPGGGDLGLSYNETMAGIAHHEVPSPGNMAGWSGDLNVWYYGQICPLADKVDGEMELEGSPFTFTHTCTVVAGE